MSIIDQKMIFNVQLAPVRSNFIFMEQNIKGSDYICMINKRRSQSSAYMIGKPPIFDPCKDCIVQVNCSETCRPKILFDNKESGTNKYVEIRLRGNK